MTAPLEPALSPLSNAQRHGPLLGAWLASYGSANTRTAYRRDALVLLEHFDARSLDLLTARRRDLDLFARTRQAAGDSPATVARRLAAASALYRYALNEEQTETNPAAHARRPVVDPDHTTTAALTCGVDR